MVPHAAKSVVHRGTFHPPTDCVSRRDTLRLPLFGRDEEKSDWHGGKVHVVLARHPALCLGCSPGRYAQWWLSDASTVCTPQLGENVGICSAVEACPKQ